MGLIQGIGIAKSVYNAYTKKGAWAPNKPSKDPDKEGDNPDKSFVKNFKSSTKYDAAIALNPDDPNAWMRRGVVLVDDKGEYEESLESFERVHELAPKYPDGWYWHGRALYYLERYAESFESFDKALELKHSALSNFFKGGPTIDEYVWWFWRGVAAYNLGRYEEALNSFDRAIYKDSIDKAMGCNRRVGPEEWLWHGKTLIKLGKYSEAIKSFDKELANDCASENLKNEAKYYREIALKKFLTST